MTNTLVIESILKKAHVHGWRKTNSGSTAFTIWHMPIWCTITDNKIEIDTTPTWTLVDRKWPDWCGILPSIKISLNDPQSIPKAVQFIKDLKNWKILRIFKQLLPHCVDHVVIETERILCIDPEESSPVSCHEPISGVIIAIYYNRIEVGMVKEKKHDDGTRDIFIDNIVSYPGDPTKLAQTDPKGWRKFKAIIRRKVREGSYDYFNLKREGDL